MPVGVRRHSDRLKALDGRALFFGEGEKAILNNVVTFCHFAWISRARASHARLQPLRLALFPSGCPAPLLPMRWLVLL